MNLALWHSIKLINNRTFNCPTNLIPQIYIHRGCALTIWLFFRPFKSGRRIRFINRGTESRHGQKRNKTAFPHSSSGTDFHARSGKSPRHYAGWREGGGQSLSKRSSFHLQPRLNPRIPGHRGRRLSCRLIIGAKAGLNPRKQSSRDRLTADDPLCPRQIFVAPEITVFHRRQSVSTMRAQGWREKVCISSQSQPGSIQQDLRDEHGGLGERYLHPHLHAWLGGSMLRATSSFVAISRQTRALLYSRKWLQLDEFHYICIMYIFLLFLLDPKLSLLKNPSEKFNVDVYLFW